MFRTSFPWILGLALCGGCESDTQPAEYPLDGITVIAGFDEPICGGTFDWIEARLRWLAAETGLSISNSPIQFHWLREEIADHCESGACTFENRIYSPLESIDHELVHGHFAQLGSPRPWLAEGMATMLEDDRWSAPDLPTAPSYMLGVTKALELDYDSAGMFVAFLRDRVGMPALLELYAALDGADEQRTREVFLELLGADWSTAEGAFMASYAQGYTGTLNCDFPELAPQAGAWTMPVGSRCADPSAIGPFLGWDDDFPPYTKRFVTLNIPEDGAYQLTLTSTAPTSVELIACDVARKTDASLYDTITSEEVQLVAGRYRLRIGTDIADEATGDVVLRGPL